MKRFFFPSYFNSRSGIAWLEVFGRTGLTNDKKLGWPLKFQELINYPDSFNISLLKRI